MTALTSLSKLNIQYDKYAIELGNNQYSTNSFEKIKKIISLAADQ